ncbi:MAG: 2-phospho-L-lactate guanylyltransferase [Actinomycetota bacterium]
MKLVIVPMKPLARAKERLSEVLTPQQRRMLSLAMLEDVTRAAGALDAVWVLTSDDDAVEVARKAGAEARPDPTPDAGLNASLIAATDQAIAEGAQGVLILSADCPAATAEDVLAIAIGPGVVLAPDRTGKGTNALWRSPPNAIEPSFGTGSRRAHFARAHLGGVSFAVIARARIALDIDDPRDLETARNAPVGPATRAALDTLGYPRHGR